MINCGIEIEFLSNDYNDLFTELMDKTDVTITGDANYNSLSLMIKPETSVKGYEINIPPTFTEEQLQQLCNIMKDRTYFVNNCAMHIHIAMNDSTKLHHLNNYYIEHEQQIINEANSEGLYVDLNYSNAVRPTLSKKNMNIYKAFEEHRTVEHRIYKATFNYNKIIWAINQTKRVISEATSELSEIN